MQNEQYSFFNKEKFAELLKRAIGKQSINRFWLQTEVSSAYISRLLRCKIENPPSPEIIRKLASHAHDGITYEDFMEAAGHIQRTSVQAIADSDHWQKVSESTTDYLIDNKSDLVNAIAQNKNISREVSEKIVHDFLANFGNLPKEKQLELVSAIVSSVKIVHAQEEK